MSAAKKKTGGAGPGHGGSTKAPSDTNRVVASNRRARHDYEILETIECGIALQGSEVKSLRAGRIALQDAYARIIDGEMWLFGVHVPPYAQANGFGAHEPDRHRKLLLHRREIERLVGSTHEKGLTLVPTRLYFAGTRSRAKVEIALDRGKNLYDKRDTIRKRDMARDVQRELRDAGR